MTMLGKRFHTGSIVVVIACLAIATERSGTALGQQGTATKRARTKRAPTRKSVTKSKSRPKTGTEEKSVADRIVLRDRKELFGQVDDSSTDTVLTVLARREMVRKTLPDWSKKWEDAERGMIVAALRQRRDRLAIWRRERPPQPAPDDRITAWLDRELSETPGSVAPSPLIAIRLGRSDVSAVERRSQSAAQALKSAWLLGLAEPELMPSARLKDLIADRGFSREGDESIALDRMLPPTLEPEDRWLLRRAATEVLHDENLRYIRFGSSVLPEPVPGQPIDPATAATLVEGTIRDVLGVGAGDALPLRFRAAAARDRVGLVVTSIEIAPDLGSAAAESILYYRRGSDWGRSIWRSQRLEVGAVPPVVVSLVAHDPQVKAVMNLIDAIGAGFVSPQMKERGLIVGATVGGAVVLARTALVRSLMGLAFNVESKSPCPCTSAWAPEHKMNHRPVRAPKRTGTSSESSRCPSCFS